jgi:hypothetical protein
MSICVIDEEYHLYGSGMKLIKKNCFATALIADLLDINLVKPIAYKIIHHVVSR